MSSAFSSSCLPGDTFHGTFQTGHVIPSLMGNNSEIVLRGHDLSQNLLHLETTDKAMNYISGNILKLFCQNYKRYDVKEDRYLNWNQLAPQVSYIHNIAMMSYLSNPLYNRPLGLTIQPFLFEDSAIIKEKLSMVRLYIPHIATKTHPGTLSSQPVKHEIVRSFHDTRINSHIPIERRILKEISKTPTILSEMFTTDNIEKQKELQPYVRILRENFTKQLNEACYLQIESLKKGKINNILEMLTATAPSVSELKAIAESSDKKLTMQQIISNIINYKEITMFGLTKHPSHFMTFGEDVFTRYTKVLTELNPSPLLNNSTPVAGIIILSGASKQQLEKANLLVSGTLQHEKDVYIIQLQNKDLDQQNKFFTKNNLNTSASSTYKVSFNSPDISLDKPGNEYGTHKMNFPVQYQYVNGKAFIVDDIDDVYITDSDKVKHPLRNCLVMHFHTQYNWLNPTQAGNVCSSQNTISFGMGEHRDPRSCYGPSSIGVYDKDANLLFVNNEKIKNVFTNPILYTDAFVQCYMKYMNRAEIGNNHVSSFLKFLHSNLDKIEKYDNILENLIKYEGKNYNYTNDLFKDVLYGELHPFFDLSVTTTENNKSIKATRRILLGSVPYYLLPIGAHFRRGRQLLFNIFPEKHCDLNAPSLSRTLTEFGHADWGPAMCWSLSVIDKIIQFCTSMFGDKMSYIHPAFSDTKFVVDRACADGDVFQSIFQKDISQVHRNIFALCILPVIVSHFCVNPTEDQAKLKYTLYDSEFEFLQIHLDIAKFTTSTSKRYNIMYKDNTRVTPKTPLLFTRSFNKTVDDIINSPCSHLEKILALFTSMITITPDSFNLTMDVIDPGFGLTLVKAEVLQTDDIIFAQNEAQCTLMDIPKTSVTNINEDNSTVIINSEITTSFMSNAINASATCYNHANLHDIKTDMGCQMHYYDNANVASGIISPELLQYEYFSSCKLAKEQNKFRCNTQNYLDANVTSWVPIICPPHVPQAFVTSSHNPRGRNTLFMGLNNSQTDNKWQCMFDHSIRDGRFKEFQTTVNPWASQVFSLGHCMYSNPSMKINDIQNMCYQKFNTGDVLDISCFFDEPYLYKKGTASCPSGNSLISTISRSMKDWRIPGNSEKFPSRTNISGLSKVALCSDNFSKIYGLSQPKFSFSDREIALEFMSKLNQNKSTNGDSLEEVVYWKNNSYLIPGSTLLGPLERRFKLSEFLFHKDICRAPL